jgi:hypothetical protein
MLIERQILERLPPIVNSSPYDDWLYLVYGSVYGKAGHAIPRLRHGLQCPRAV